MNLTDWQTPWTIIGWIVLVLMLLYGLMVLAETALYAAVRLWNWCWELGYRARVRRAHKGLVKCDNEGCENTATKYTRYRNGKPSFYCGEHLPRWVSSPRWLEYARVEEMKKRGKN